MKKPVDMKVSKKEAYGDVMPVSTSGKGKVYPWGLELRLNAAALDKLGIKDLPDVDCECLVNAVAVVTRVEKAAVGGEKTRSLTLQITKLALEHPDEEKAFERGFRRGPKRHKGY